jgi:hypothetical protein
LFSSGHIFDVDQDTLGGFASGDSLRKVLAAGKLDAEASIITIKREHWVWYDTDGDGVLDLLLRSGPHPGTVVRQAWRRSEDGEYTEEPAMAGRLILQPELVGAGDQARKLRRLASRVLPRSMVAEGGGVKSLPNPNSYYPWGYKLKSVNGRKGVAAKVRMYHCKGLLVDVDRDTARKAKRAKKKVEDMVRARKFDAEFARVSCGNNTWTYYDTRGKGSYDLILYTPGKSDDVAAYAVNKEGKLMPRKRELGCKGLVHPALFKSRGLRRKFTAIVDKLLPDEDLSCKRP